MKLTLTRYMQNRTYTFGKLQIDGMSDSFDTLERAIPRDNNSYVKHCLPPGTYPFDVTLSLLTVNGGTIRKPFPSFQKVRWFPKAALLSYFETAPLLAGHILIGMGTPDEWSITQNDIVTAKIIAAMSNIYDHDSDSATEPVTLEIIEAPDIIVHDYDRQQYERELAELKELQARQEAEQRLQQLLDEAKEGGVLK